MRYLIEAARSKGLDRIAIAYAVAAWVVVQAAAIAAPAYAWPPWVLQLIILVALLGLPVVLIGAWAHSVRRRKRMEPSPKIASRFSTLPQGEGEARQREVGFALTLALMALVFGSVVVWTFWPRTGVMPLPGESASAPPANSLAVLPFVNLAGQANDYFSDGITDELLNALAGRRGLRIAARTSSFAFKGKNLDAQAIARALHVRNLLTGSVREAGNHVRITAQLTNAADGYELWSHSYDRDLTDILAVQADIANAISGELARRLGNAGGGAPAAPAPATAPIDRDAYRMYLEAKDLVYRSNEEDLTRATALLGSATEKAPNFAAGYALLGNAWHELYERYSKAAALMPAETAYQQALNLEPANVVALVGLLGIRLDHWQWNEALDTFRRLQAANPNQVLVLHAQSNLAYIFDYPEQDLAAERKAIELDPLKPALWYDLALWYWNEKRYTEADAAIGRLLQIRHGKYTDRDMQCLIAVGLGRLDEADAIAAGISGYYKESAQNALSCPFAIAIARHDNARARAMIAPAIADYEKNGGSEMTIAESYRTLGDLAGAMPWYERSYQARDTLLLFAPYEKFQSHALVDYPPWKALWSRPPIRAWASARAEAGQILGVKGS